MKKFLNIFALAVLSALAVGCDKEKPQSELSDQITVNYRNMRGVWELTELEGGAIEGDAYFYIIFSLDERERQFFEVYSTLDSAFASKSEGVYYLESDPNDRERVIISGIYDNMFQQPWSSSYIVSSLTSKKMEWRDYTSGEVRSYERVEEVPSDILAGTRSK